MLLVVIAIFCINSFLITSMPWPTLFFPGETALIEGNRLRDRKQRLVSRARSKSNTHAWCCSAATLESLVSGPLCGHLCSIDAGSAPRPCWAEFSGRCPAHSHDLLFRAVGRPVPKVEFLPELLRSARGHRPLRHCLAGALATPAEDLFSVSFLEAVHLIWRAVEALVIRSLAFGCSARV